MAGSTPGHPRRHSIVLSPEDYAFIANKRGILVFAIRITYTALGDEIPDEFNTWMLAGYHQTLNKRPRFLAPYDVVQGEEGEKA
jgi:hypothetical protein